MVSATSVDNLLVLFNKAIHEKVVILSQLLLHCYCHKSFLELAVWILKSCYLFVSERRPWRKLILLNWENLFTVKSETGLINKLVLQNWFQESHVGPSFRICLSHHPGTVELSSQETDIILRRMSFTQAHTKALQCCYSAD